MENHVCQCRAQGDCVRDRGVCVFQCLAQGDSPGHASRMCVSERNRSEKDRHACVQRAARHGAAARPVYMMSG
eukprot:303662-Rhodomonas_salina.1